MGKQVLENLYTEWRMDHNCLGQKTLRFRPDRGTKADDSWIMYRGQLFRVERCLDEGNLACRRFISASLDTSHIGMDLPWGSVGVHAVIAPIGEQLEEDEVIIKASDAQGKAVLHESHILTYPKEWLGYY